MPENYDEEAVCEISRISRECGINVEGAKIRRTSSRFCLGVEHGDYNGTELFGVGTDRFIWFAFKPDPSGRIKIFSGNFPADGVIDFELGRIPQPRSSAISGTWARFPFGVDHILRQEGYILKIGLTGIIYGNIPGGGMSRSASLTLNLILSLLEVNRIEIQDSFRLVDLAQAVETDYIGSPCGQLDQIMILFAKEGLGTHYKPRDRTITHVPLGKGADFRLVSLDTGTERPGLEKSTYRIRRAECEELVALLRKKYGIQFLGDIKEQKMYEEIVRAFGTQYPGLCKRLKYIFFAQKRFVRMLEAWKKGDIAAIGDVFRKDGYSLRDDYMISGPELEAMCDIARTVSGVYGERMLGGGDKGASGAIAAPESIQTLKDAVGSEFPKKYPALREKFAVHACSMVDGVKMLEGLI